MTGRIDFDCDVLVVGGGAAGVTAALSLARAGLSVHLCEQRAMLGGAYYRQPVDSATTSLALRRVSQWARLMAELSASNVRLGVRRVFLGLDADGLALLDDRALRQVASVRARALVLAVGAVEKVTPRPGWQLNSVTTSGGLQMLLKETGAAPAGDILIAGTGPLNIALAADLVKSGRRPVAVVEAGDPVAKSMTALGLVAFPGLLAEAAAHMCRLLVSGIPWFRGTAVTGIERNNGRLVAILRDRHGNISSQTADLIALHDGIRPNDFGLPADPGSGPVVVRAGDCREALGIRAAIADGEAAANQVVSRLSGGASQLDDKAVSRQRRAQSILGKLFDPVGRALAIADIPDDTVVCRCEGRTAGELRGLLAGPDQPGLREIRLNGRFGMGPCQGRFCADNVRALAMAARPISEISTDAISRDRWPIKPVSIASLIADNAIRGQE